MVWFTSILKGSNHKRQYHGTLGDDRYWEEPRRSVVNSSDFDKDEIDCAIAPSLSEHHKGKKVIDADNDSNDSEEVEIYLRSHLVEDENFKRAQQEEEEKRMRAQHVGEEKCNHAQQEEGEKRVRAQLEEDEKLAQAHARAQSEEDEILAKALPSGHRICAGCNSEIGHGRYLNCMDSVWHPECFCCNACNHPITDLEFLISCNRPYHKSCYKEQYHPRCDVCSNFIPTNSAGLIEYRAHPFWLQKYCPSHELDRTPRCCSCERMEPRNMKYVSLDDGRRLCLECLDSLIMDTHECQQLHFEIREFFEGLQMKVEQEIPMLLVERQALNEAMEGEKNDHHHLPETRGLCLSEEQTTITVSRRPRIVAGYRFMEVTAIFKCKVTAILILFGLPRLLTGSILAHEMMHAWLRLKGYTNLRPEVEEGICQVLAHMWLDSEIYLGSWTDNASSSTSSSSPSSSSSASLRKGKKSDFEKKLGEFFKHQIELDSSTVYGDGFRMGNKAVLKFGARSTLDHIRMTGTFPL